MKKIQSSIKMLAALLVAGAAFTACSSDDTVSEQPVNPAQQTYTMTVNATKGSNATTRALSLSGSTLNATWATTENVYVKKGDTWATGSLKPQADGATATLSGTLSGVEIAAGNTLTLQFPKSGDISYSGQLGTLANIAANFDYATANVEVESVTDGNINVSGTTNFDNQQAIIKFTLKDKATSAAIKPSALTITDGTNTVTLSDIPDATYTTNGDGVLYVAFPAAGESKTITLTATVDGDTYTYEKSGVTFSNGKYYAINVKIIIAVDLGLPSGVKWASMNVGASTPWGYGDYFAWGETTTKDFYNWSTYTLCNGSNTTLTKYCYNSSYGYNGFTDTKTVLDMEDDAAHANWGGDWRMPTKAEFSELITNTTSAWTTQNGVNGWEFTSKKEGNTNFIFLPAAGYRLYGTLRSVGSDGNYWSSTPGEQCYAWFFGFTSEGRGMYYGDSYGRSYGRSVRPVR